MPSSSTAGGPKEDLKTLIKKVPRDSDGYTVSFDPADTANWLSFFAEHGFVVIKLLNPQECAATRAEFFSSVNALPPCDPAQLSEEGEEGGEKRKRRKRLVAIDDPLSWEDGNWPVRGRYLVQHPASTPQALHNRTHPNLHKVYSALFNQFHTSSSVGSGAVGDAIFSNMDVWGVMRGSSGLVPPDNATDDELATWGGSERPEWRTHLDPHWDTNPRNYIEDTRKSPSDPPGSGKRPILFQGVLALVDCDDSVGGFTIAPASAPQLHKWVAAVPKQKDERPNHYDAAPSDPWRSLTQNVPIREGEYVLWDSGALHANYPNAGPSMRLVQYMRCSTDLLPKDPQWGAHLPTDENLERKFPGFNLKECVAAAEAAGLPLSEQQLQMLGLVPYNRSSSSGKKKSSKN